MGFYFVHQSNHRVARQLLYRHHIGPPRELPTPTRTTSGKMAIPATLESTGTIGQRPTSFKAVSQTGRIGASSECRAETRKTRPRARRASRGRSPYCRAASNGPRLGGTRCVRHAPPHSSRLMSDASRLTPHAPRLAPRASRLAPRASATRNSQLASLHSSFKTRHSLKGVTGLPPRKPKTPTRTASGRMIDGESSPEGIAAKKSAIRPGRQVRPYSTSCGETILKI